MSERLRRVADADIARVAALIGDPGRAAMLLSLLDGGEHAASELAARAGLSPQAATAHLKKLVAGALIGARTSGRNRLFSIASPDVGAAIEALASVAGPRPIVALEQRSKMERLRAARSCYDHLAGRIGVAVTERLIERGALRRRTDRFALTRDGETFLDGIGVDVVAARAAQRPFARVCIDWTERRPHLAGSLGARLLSAFVANAWVERRHTDRALAVTAAGANALERYFDVTV